jgi:hypothetical protein
VLEVVAAKGDICFLKERNTWKSQNRHTDGHTPTYISQRWTRITTSVIECSNRWWS